MKVKQTVRKRKQRGGARQTTARSQTINDYMVAMGDHDGYKSPSEDRHSVLAVGDMSLLVCVFDGHSGSQTAEYVNKNLPVRIKERIESGNSFRDVDAVKKIMEEEFEKIDKEIRGKIGQSGSTGSVVFINPDTIVVANVGDSPVLYFTKSGELLFHSIDHDCNNSSEVKRVEEAGGKCLMRPDGVMGVGGALMVTRAFGDFYYKPSVTATPQTYSVERKPGTYLVVCSDSFTERYVPERNQIMNVATPENVVKEILPALQSEELEAGVRAAVDAQVKREKLYYPEQPAHYQYMGDNTTLVAVKFKEAVENSTTAEGGGRRKKTQRRKVRKEKTRKTK